MVSAGVCFGGKEILHFIPDKTKVNAKLYVETLLPEHVQGCRSVLPSGFIFQQDTRQSWLKTGLLPVPTGVNSLVKMNGLRTRWPQPSGLPCLGAMLERYKSFQPKPENIDELNKVLQLIWDQLPQDLINKAILSFPKRLRACVKAGDGHFEHMLKWTTCQILVYLITVNVSCQWKLQVAVDYSVQNWKYGTEYVYSHNFRRFWHAAHGCVAPYVDIIRGKWRRLVL